MKTFIAAIALWASGATGAGAITVGQKLALLTTNACTYYIDSAAGSDANSGRSPAAPLADVTSIPKLSGGQTVCLKSGSFWQEDLFIGVPGANVNNITVKSYGAGPLPTLDASDVIPSSAWT